MNKTVHRIWLNEEPPPPALQRIGESWADEQVEFWDHERVKTLEGIDEHLSLIDRIWKPQSIEWWRAKSDVTRYAILRDHGGLYVDMDCERVGDVWYLGERAAVDASSVVLVQPIRPRRLDRNRPCNGVIYCDVSHSLPMDSSLEVALFRLEQHKGSDVARAVEVTGPGMFEDSLMRWKAVSVVHWGFAGFKGCETPDTRIIIHQNWRNYRA